MLKKKGQVLQIRLENDLLARVKLMAERNGVTVSFMLREVLFGMCERHEVNVQLQAAAEVRQKAIERSYAKKRKHG